jgi:hypothetical protein
MGLRSEIGDPGVKKPCFIQFDPFSFRITETQDVRFDMKDVECQWWKSGITFDFIQLKKLD